MKKFLFTLVIALGSILGANAQKFALVDMDYILSSIPNYEMANSSTSSPSVGRKRSRLWLKKPRPCTRTIRTRWCS
jgi:hypothetical protein